MWRFKAVRGEFEAREFKGWGHRASNKCPIPERLRLLPMALLDDALRAFAVQHIRAEPQGGPGAMRWCGREHERGAGVPVPDLDGVNTMPA